MRRHTPTLRALRRRNGSRRDLRGGELEVELAQAPQHPGGCVLEAAITVGTVVLLRQPDVVHALQDALDADPALRARERCSRTRVVTAPERDVVHRVRAVDAEVGRALEA